MLFFCSSASPGTYELVRAPSHEAALRYAKRRFKHVQGTYPIVALETGDIGQRVDADLMEEK